MKKKLSRIDKVLNTLFLVGAVCFVAGLFFNLAKNELLYAIFAGVGAACFGVLVVVGFIHMVKNEWS